MKRIAVIIIGLAFVALAQTPMSPQGGKLVETGMVYWRSDSLLNLVVYPDSVMVDSSGTLIRIDDTSDSCSQWITIPGPLPLYQYRFEASLVDTGTANAVGMNVHRRTKQPFVVNNSRGYWGEVRVGAEQSYPEITVLDTLSYTAISTARHRAAANASLIDADQIRLCPQVHNGTGVVKIDSTSFRLK